MKNVTLIFTLLLIIGCKKENKNQLHLGMNNSDKFSSSRFDKKPILEDTIFFVYDEKSKWDDFALVYLLDNKYTKDSICVATFKLDFKSNTKIIYSKTLQINRVDEGSEWSGVLELDSIASPLKRLSFGYPACGYLQNNFLFYINKSDSNLIHQWDSSSDSGWGYWSEVVSGKPEDFYFRTESFSPVDETVNDDELGLNEYSDSIHFKLENNKWNTIYKTPKGKVYRSKKISFTNFFLMVKKRKLWL